MIRQDSTPVLSGSRIHISGVVQGVGFRPFVFSLATRLGLAGWVRNTSAGVDIEVDGPPEDLQAFTAALSSEAPPLARIDQFEAFSIPAQGFAGFTIVHSEAIDGAFQPISPDMCTCPDCLRELFDPEDRRYRYPFINCTNCGPRFTIIQDIPYDRPNTTMADFKLCRECAAEYQDPHDRRFHAQPVACPKCGPQIWLEIPTPGGKTPDYCGDVALLQAQRLLNAGKIVAVKGLGGFHLACDAGDPAAVEELRRRKLRAGKAFAVMFASLNEVERHCQVSPEERALLTSRERPIVILEKKDTSPLPDSLAPRQHTIGGMLPYTPLHYLLFAAHPLAEPGELPPQVLVMTSGNLSEEPIATHNQEARERLAGLADAFLMHDRPIQTRCDDSVMRSAVLPGRLASILLPVRRSRGYAPFPVRLPWDSIPLLAGGAELKNTFCLARGRYAFLSQHIGDLENYETLTSFTEGIEHYQRLFRIRPEGLACDVHPDYLATRYLQDLAEQERLPLVSVQHHHAHIASAMVENGLGSQDSVIGVALDGTGFGEDGAIWGGEFLIAGYSGFRRSAHLAYTPLPGGDKAVREPWRMALSWLHSTGLEWSDDLPPVQYARMQPASLRTPEIDLVRQQILSGINAPLTSSMGRLFDAAASLAGVCHRVTFEAQAAIELEALVDGRPCEAYPYDLLSSGPNEAWIIDPAPLFAAMVGDLRRGIGPTVIAARFHQGTARMVIDVCRLLREQSGLDRVALSGGVWQNLTLLKLSVHGLQQAGFTVYLHSQVPANDGGLALGQIAVASQQLRQS